MTTPHPTPAEGTPIATPLTDANICQASHYVNGGREEEWEYVEPEFARSLETRLHTTQSRLEEAILAVEAAHFRTNEDTGANLNALVVWSAFRRAIGLPPLSWSDLPKWDETKHEYVVPEGSRLMAHLARHQTSGGSNL